MNLFWGCSIANLVSRCDWYSVNDKPDAFKWRCYYGIRIGPIIVVITRWNRS